MTAVRLIVGLGNPGAEYQDTRHNAGFWFVDRVAQTGSASFRHESRFHGEVARVVLEGQDLWLLKPSTYMNDSGRAVAAMAHFYRVAPEQILVVHDELDLPPGGVKLKKGGGAAGHNGLKDLLLALDAPDFWRLRVGIGHPGQRHQVVDYVLHRPAKAEQEAIDVALDRALDILPLLVKGQAEAALMTLHTPPKAGGLTTKD
jgi:PTH1 family peptidyl-tRNA hydrolase